MKSPIFTFFSTHPRDENKEEEGRGGNLDKGVKRKRARATLYVARHRRRGCGHRHRRRRRRRRRRRDDADAWPIVALCRFNYSLASLVNVCGSRGFHDF